MFVPNDIVQVVYLRNASFEPAWLVEGLIGTVSQTLGGGELVEVHFAGFPKALLWKDELELLDEYNDNEDDFAYDDEEIEGVLPKIKGGSFKFAVAYSHPVTGEYFTVAAAVDVETAASILAAFDVLEPNNDYRIYEIATGDFIDIFAEELAELKVN